MIRFFRTKRKTTFLILFIFAAILMTTFGMDFKRNGSRSNRADAAIIVDDVKISHADYFNKRREVESRYRQMLGAQYDKFSKQLGLNVPQQVLDGMIAEAVWNKETNARGFVASDEEVVAELQKIFPSGYSPELLRSSGKTPETFLDEVRGSLAKGQLVGVLEDGAIPSNQETVSALSNKNRTFDLQYAEFDPAQFVAEVKDPSQNELETFYNDRKDSFEIPARISYEYLTFSPEQFLGQIDVPDDEIEFYYTENQDKFSLPEELHVKHIQFLYPKERDAQKLSAVKDKALKVLERANAGEKFESLAMEASDDITTKTLGGDLGWVAKGKLEKDFDEKAFKVKSGGIAELIEAENGFRIVKVEGYKESKLKPLAEVRDEISTILKKEQAPAFAHAKAEECYDAFTSSDTPLSEIAKKYGMSSQKSAGLLLDTQDPSPALTGLSAKVLGSSSDPKQLVELKELSIVVGVIESKEPEIPALADIKSNVVTEYKKVKSVEIARAAASKFVAEVATKDVTSFEPSAKAAKATLKKVMAFKEGSPPQGPLSDESVLKSVLYAQKIPSVSSEVRTVNGKFYAVQVLKANDKETAPTAKEKLDERFALSSSEGSELSESLTSHLKSLAKIDFDKTILGVES